MGRKSRGVSTGDHTRPRRNEEVSDLARRRRAKSIGGDASRWQPLGPTGSCNQDSYQRHPERTPLNVGRLDITLAPSVASSPTAVRQSGHAVLLIGLHVGEPKGTGDRRPEVPLCRGRRLSRRPRVRASRAEPGTTLGDRRVVDSTTRRQAARSPLSRVTLPHAPSAMASRGRSHRVRRGSGRRPESP